MDCMSSISHLILPGNLFQICPYLSNNSVIKVILPAAYNRASIYRIV